MDNLPDLTTLLIIVAIAALAPVIVDLRPSLRVPVIVVEIALGILIGPQVLGWVHVDSLVDFMSQLGLAFLFFLAGMEINFAVIRGRPLRLAAIGWVCSALLGFALAGGLHAAGIVVSGLLTGAALCTTALGALIPILRDAGETKTRFGTFVLAIGAAGEFGPIVLIAVLLSSDSSHIVPAILLLVFTLLAFVGAMLATKIPARTREKINRTMESSGQLPTRLSIVILLGLVTLAAEFSLDVILGAFAAGLIVGTLVRTGDEQIGEKLRSKLEGLGYGFFIPLFFIVTGVEFDLDSLISSPTAILKLPLFVVLLLVVRGLPVLLLYRKDVPRSELKPLALFAATGLPLIVAITAIGVDTDRMLPETAAALVGAGMLSIFCFPLLGLLLRRRGAAASPAEP